MKFERKLIIAVIAILSFTAVLIVKDTFDPLALGGGLATFLATIMYGFGAEYKNKNKE